MEHVRIGDDDVPGGANQPPHVGGCVAVVRVRLDIGSGRFDQAVQVRVLVLSQRLGREEVERSRGRVAHDRVDHRQVVAQRFSRGSRGHHGGMIARLNAAEGVRLVRIKVSDPAGPERLSQLRIQIRWKVHGFSRNGRNRAPGDDVRRESRVGPKILDRLQDRHWHPPWCCFAIDGRRRTNVLRTGRL